MTTYPAFYPLAALLAAIAWAAGLPAAILAVIGFTILAVVDVWKERVDG